MPKRTILVVEDEPDIKLLIKRSLGMKNFQVWLAGSGKQALKILQKHKPDLILLDILMPEMDGFEVCRRIKTLPELSHIPVAFLTVRNNKEDILRGREVGALGYFLKPFDPFTLDEEVEKLLSQANVPA